MEFLKYIDKILECSDKDLSTANIKGCKVGDFIIKFWTDGDKFLDGLQYCNTKEGIFWTYSNPKEFFNNFLNDEYKFKFKEISMNFLNDTKLSKPKELKGIKQSLSIPYIDKKCKCMVFINGNDVWVKHGDYLSPSLNEDIKYSGTPLSARLKEYCKTTKFYHKDKFIYADTWGDIVLRRQVWLKLENLIHFMKFNDSIEVANEIVRQQEINTSLDVKSGDLLDTSMHRFWENLILEVNEIKKEEV